MANISTEGRLKLAVALGAVLGDQVADILDSVDVLSDTEAGFLDGVVAGVGAVSKALVLDANGRVTNPYGNGTANGTGVAATEYGSEAMHKTVLTFTDHAIALTDQAGVVAYGGSKVYDFPEGAIRILGAVLDVDLTKSSSGVNDDWDGDVGVGTATAGNDATLSTTEQDIIPTTATPQAAAGATTANAQSTSTEDEVHDGTGTAKDAFVNFLVDDADHDVNTTPCNLILNGTLTIFWTNLGDY